MSENSNPSEAFVRQLSDCQVRLLGYVQALVANRDAAHDVLQDTNVVLWRKAHTYQEGTNFMAWATRVAYFEAMAYLRRQSRDRLVFDENIIQAVAERAGDFAQRSERIPGYLDECVDRCSEPERQLLHERYGTEIPVKEMAQRRGVTANKISVTLCRLRRKLLKCIQNKMAAAGLARSDSSQQGAKH